MLYLPELKVGMAKEKASDTLVKGCDYTEADILEIMTYFDILA